MIHAFQVTLQHWLKGIRLYIAIATLLISAEVWWWANTAYSGTSLFTIRLEQTYAWLAVGLITLAVIIGPLYKVWPKLPLRFVMYDARRMFGIAATWFAALHVYLAFFVQFKAPNPLTIPTSYRSAFLLGAIALVILLLMTITSFNAAQRSMGTWWYRLHRLIYAAIVLILFHAFMIGTHAAEWTSLIILTAAAVVIFGLQVYLSFVRRDRPTIWQLLTISAMFLLLLAVFNYGYGQKLGYSPLEGKYGHHQQ